MSYIIPQYEHVDNSLGSIRYLEHGWPTNLCRWHSHPEYELHFITATHGTVFIGDYIGDFSPNSLFLVGPHLPHNWVTDEDFSRKSVDVRDMLVQFSADSIEPLTKAFSELASTSELWELAGSGIEFVGFEPAVAYNHLLRIRNTKGVQRVAAFIDFLDCLVAHTEKCKLSLSNCEIHDLNDKDFIVFSAIDYILQNYSQSITLEKMANFTGMCPHAFSRKFQKSTGKTLIKFINELRINQACSMLYETEDSISRICYEVGFNNLSNFNRHFLRIKGLSPSAYRKKALQGLLQTD